MKNASLHNLLGGALPDSPESDFETINKADLLSVSTLPCETNEQSSEDGPGNDIPSHNSEDESSASELSECVENRYNIKHKYNPSSLDPVKPIFFVDSHVQSPDEKAIPLAVFSAKAERYYSIIPGSVLDFYPVLGLVHKKIACSTRSQELDIHLAIAQDAIKFNERIFRAYQYEYNHPLHHFSRTFGLSGQAVYATLALIGEITAWQLSCHKDTAIFTIQGKNSRACTFSVPITQLTQEEYREVSIEKIDAYGAQIVAWERGKKVAFPYMTLKDFKLSMVGVVKHFDFPIEKENWLTIEVEGPRGRSCKYTLPLDEVKLSVHGEFQLSREATKALWSNEQRTRVLTELGRSCFGQF